jgi:hypothetical protein
VVPNIQRQLPDSTVIVLGKAVLWLVYSTVADNFLSSKYCELIQESLLETGINVVSVRIQFGKYRFKVQATKVLLTLISTRVLELLEKEE